MDGEKLLTIPEAAKQVAKISRQKRKPGISTVWRWTSIGCRGVVLETVMIGGNRYTSAEALERFFLAIANRNRPDAAPVASPARRKRRQAAAERELDAAGI